MPQIRRGTAGLCVAALQVMVPSELGIRVGAALGSDSGVGVKRRYGYTKQRAGCVPDRRPV